MFSVSITTFDRTRKFNRDRNYFSMAYPTLVEAGLLDHPLISSVDIFVGHEKDEWCEKTLPKDVPIHYFDEQVPHTDVIMKVLKHAVRKDLDNDNAHHLYLEDDVVPFDPDIFNQMWNYQTNIIPNPEAFGVHLDSRPSDTVAYIKNGYRQEALNTFTSVMMAKSMIRKFLHLHPTRFPQCKAPDHYMGKALMQPTYVAVPGLVKHIGLQSAAHKRCLKRVMGIVNYEFEDETGKTG